MQDAGQIMQRLQQLQHHCRQAMDSGQGHVPVTYGELQYLVDAVMDGFSVIGVGRRGNAAGQAYPPKRGWELHG